MHDIIKTGKRVLITGNPIFDEKGEIDRVVTNVRDITELNKLKQELENKEKQAARYQNELAQLRSQSGGERYSCGKPPDEAYL
jgi:transcriptional regulator with PAS, ATPase and Fis domain